MDDYVSKPVRVEELNSSSLVSASDQCQHDNRGVADMWTHAPSFQNPHGESDSAKILDSGSCGTRWWTPWAIKEAMVELTELYLDNAQELLNDLDTAFKLRKTVNC